MLVCASNFDKQGELAYIDRLIALGVDGFIVQPTARFKEISKSISESGKPLVFIDSKLYDFSSNWVKTDNYEASYRAVEACIEKGYKRFLVVTATPGLISSRIERFSGFVDALEAYDLGFTQFLIENDQVDTGKIAAVSTKEAKKYAASLYKKQHTLGFISCYRYQLVTTGDNTRMYIFVNCERELNTFHTFLLASIGISLAGLLLVFLLVVLFSGMLVKPVAESYEKQKRFITDASHEIKTPLTIIDANTEVLEMTGGENQWTKSTRKQIARLTSLTEKLVFLSRMDEESTQLEMTDFAISDAVIDTAEPFVSYAASRGKTLELDIAPDLTYHGNEGCIRQCVSLLLDNAVKYSTENGKLRLTFHKQGRALALTVWNTTDPIPVGRHDELFERFYRPDSSRNTKTGGHGIGLSVVHAIATAHKGKISAKSEDGNSLTFSILLN